MPLNHALVNSNTYVFIAYVTRLGVVEPNDLYASTVARMTNVIDFFCSTTNKIPVTALYARILGVGQRLNSFCELVSWSRGVEGQSGSAIRSQRPQV